jgi:hypothetical protein
MTLARIFGIKSNNLYTERVFRPKSNVSIYVSIFGYVTGT